MPENSSSQAHTFSFLFPHSCIIIMEPRTTTTLRIPKVLDTQVVKHGTSYRAGAERKVGLLLSLTLVHQSYSTDLKETSKEVMMCCRFLFRVVLLQL